MRLQAVPATRIPRLPRWGIAIAVAWATLVLVIAYFDAISGGSTPVCTFRRVTGLPCGTCGGTRATLALARGAFGSALALNPLVAVALLLATGYSLWRGVIGRTLRAELSRGERTAVWLGLVLLFIANWAYLIIQRR